MADADEKRRASSSTKRDPGEEGEIIGLARGETRNFSVTKDGVIINASGYPDALQRQFGLLSICGLALTINSAWIAFGGSLNVSVLNGGPSGILYEFIVACAYYAFIGASIAELASSMPSSGGVYHWTTVVSGPRYGRIMGFFTGSINFFGWMFDLASIVSIPSNVLVQMYASFHPGFQVEPWHTYVAYLGVTWLCTFFVIFCNSWISKLQYPGLVLILGGGLTTIIVCAAMPNQHATSEFVWNSFSENNMTGWPGGIAFLTGVLNGAFTVGTPDAVTHMAEEMPNPAVDLPKAVFAQVGLGFLTTFVYAISIFYAINDLDAVANSNGAFPLAEVYSQATGSAGGTFGLLFILFLSIMICSVGTLTMVGRLWWVLARDNATPFPGFFSKVNDRLSCPVQATLLCAIFCSALGAIPLGSETAFSSLVGSFIILTTVSYFLAFFPNLLTGRQMAPAGPFHMGKCGFAVNTIACLLIVMFNVFFCFPYGYPVEPLDLMNWNSVILVGVAALTTIWWFIHGRRKYPGPKLTELYPHHK